MKVEKLQLHAIMIVTSEDDVRGPGVAIPAPAGSPGSQDAWLDAWTEIVERPLTGQRIADAGSESTLSRERLSLHKVPINSNIS
jgi:hypothetical protein